MLKLKLEKHVVSDEKEFIYFRETPPDYIRVCCECDFPDCKGECEKIKNFKKRGQTDAN